MNSRLAIILEELLRSAEELIKRGGRRMYVGGDIFHVRGSINPEVFNPTHNAFQRITSAGIDIVAIPGNHDLAGKETNKLGNAIQTLGALNRFTVATSNWIDIKPQVCMIPWRSTPDLLRQSVKELQEQLTNIDVKLENFDLIIHAGIDGVLPSLPDHGLTAAECAGWGFKRVLASHYHNHKEMEDGKVVSIGATTHQTWSDIGTRAGFVFVYPDHIEFQASHAPSFVELDGETDPEDYPLVVDGNFVRIRGMKLTDGEIIRFRKELEEMGARGVMFQVARSTVTAREGSAAVKASSLEEAVDKFIDTLASIDVPLVKSECADILSSVRAVAA